MDGGSKLGCYNWLQTQTTQTTGKCCEHYGHTAPQKCLLCYTDVIFKRILAALCFQEMVLPPLLHYSVEDIQDLNVLEKINKHPPITGEIQMLKYL